MTSRRATAVLLAAIAVSAARAQEPGPPARKVNPMPLVEAAGAFSEHTYEGWLAAPLGLFFDPAQREIYVADTDGRMIGIFDEKGAPLFAFGAGLLEAPFAVAVDPREHHVYVLDQGRARVRAFSYRGAPLADLKLPGLDGRKDVVLSALHVDGRGWLYVAENKLSEVYVYDESRKLVARFGTVGYDRGQFIAILGHHDRRRERVRARPGGDGGAGVRPARPLSARVGRARGGPGGVLAAVRDCRRAERQGVRRRRAPPRGEGLRAGRRVSRTVRRARARPRRPRLPRPARVRLRRRTPRPREAERARAAVPGDRAAVAARAARRPDRPRRRSSRPLPSDAARAGSRIAGADARSAANALAPLRCRSSDARFREWVSSPSVSGPWVPRSPACGAAISRVYGTARSSGSYKWVGENPQRKNRDTRKMPINADP